MPKERDPTVNDILGVLTTQGMTLRTVSGNYTKKKGYSFTCCKTTCAVLLSIFS